MFYIITFILVDIEVNISNSSYLKGKPSPMLAHLSPSWIKYNPHWPAMHDGTWLAKGCIRQVDRNGKQTSRSHCDAISRLMHLKTDAATGLGHWACVRLDPDLLWCSEHVVNDNLTIAKRPIFWNQAPQLLSTDRMTQGMMGNSWPPPAPMRWWLCNNKCHVL